MANTNNINQDSMLKTGTVLHGTYRIDDYLSSGGFGNTYVATHILFGSKLAIKEFFMRGVTQRAGDTCKVCVSNNENLEEFKQQLEKFKKEARRLHDLDNKNIVKVHDLFEENGTAYYVMDYIDGEDLRNWQERMKCPMTEEEVMKILPQVLNALKAVHAKKMWHLDLKPANIMVDEIGTVKLIDFGASKQFDSKKGKVTSTAIAYTDGFAPIEQMEKSSDKLGPWTDFYALGSTLYNLLTNQKPPKPSDINDDHSNDKHLALPMPSSVSDKLKGLVLWLMTPNRSERPQSVDLIIERLEQSNESEGDDVTKVDPSPDPDPAPGPNKLRVLLIAIAVGTLAFVCYTQWNNIVGIVKGEGGDELQDTTTIVTPIMVQDSSVSIQLGDSLFNCYYSGEINADNVPHGKGTARFDKGDICVGTFENGRIEGDSIVYTVSNGDTFVGSFRDNEFYEGRYTSKKDGRYFVGSFKGFMPNEGQWYDINGEPIATSGNSQNMSTPVTQKAESPKKVMDQSKKPESKKSSSAKENKAKDEIKTQEQVMEEELRKSKTSNGQSAQTGQPGVSGLAGYTLEYWAKPVPNSKWSGRVVVSVTVNPKGQITEAKAIRASGDLSSHPEVRQACVQAALKSKFSVPEGTKTEGIGSITYIWH